MSDTADQKNAPNMVALAMVALYEPRLPSPTDYRQLLEQYFPDAPQPVSVELVERDHLRALSVNTGAIEGIVALMPAPMPWSDLEGPCAVAWWWPEAAEKLKDHQAHAIVTLLNQTDNIIINYLAVTRLAACLAATTNAAGVYWGAGTVVHSPERFVEQSTGAHPQNLPLELWIDFRIQQTFDGQYQLLTTGLESLNKREIEIAPCALPPVELLGLGYDIAHYMLTSGAELHDGDTIGRSASERIRIRFTRSMWNRAGEVMRLEMA